MATDQEKATAELKWYESDHIKLKLKKTEDAPPDLNTEYNIGAETMLPGYLTLFDEDGDPIQNPSFFGIQQNYSIQYTGTKYYFRDPIPLRQQPPPPLAPQQDDIDASLTKLLDNPNLEQKSLIVRKYEDPNQQVDLPLRAFALQCQTWSSFRRILLSKIRSVGTNNNNYQIQKVYYHLNNGQSERHVFFGQDTYKSFLHFFAQGIIDHNYGLILYSDAHSSPPPTPPREGSSQPLHVLGFKKLASSVLEKSPNSEPISGKVSLLILGDRFEFLDRHSELNMLTNAMLEQLQEKESGRLHEEADRGVSLNC